MRIKGVKPVTVRKRGKVYRYFRHRATGETIKAAFGTAAFAAEVAALDTKAENRGEPLPGTLGALIKSYRAAPEFTERRPRTRKDYDRVFDFLKPIEETPLLAINPAFLYALRDKAFKRHKRRFSTYVLQVLRLLLEWGKDRGAIKENPAHRIKRIRRPKNTPRANRAWTDQERDVVLREATRALRGVVALGMFAGLSEGDAIRLPWSAYDKRLIQSVRAKTGEPLWIPAHYRLRQILDELPKVSTIMAVNSRNQPWTESGFRASFFKFLKKLYVAKKIDKGLTFHGLRHTVGKLIVDAGGDTRDVGAILGHASEASSEHYSREADRQKRASATIRRLERTERKRMGKQADNSSAVSAEEGAKSLK
jgi:integrase